MSIKKEKKVVREKKEEKKEVHERVRKRTKYEPKIKLVYFNDGGRGRARISAKNPEKLLKMFEKGLTVGEIAEKCCISPFLARRFLHDAGAPLKVGQPGKREYRDMQKKMETRAKKIIKMHEKGATLRSIGDDVGVSHERVRQILKRAGLHNTQTRPPVI